MGAWVVAVYFVGCCLAGHCFNIMVRACVRGMPEDDWGRERVPKGGS